MMLLTLLSFVRHDDSCDRLECDCGLYVLIDALTVAELTTLETVNSNIVESYRRQKKMTDLHGLALEWFKGHDRPCEQNGEWRHTDEHSELDRRLREAVGASPTVTNR
jgi:hypothetical protein